MIKKIAVLLFAIMLIFMVGCDKEKPKPTGDTFLGGNDGLGIKFIEGAPPEETYDGGGYNFGISARLENLGEFEVPANKSKVTITGIEPTDFNVTPADMEKIVGTAITARKKDAQGNELPGGIVIVVFSDNFDYKGSLSGNKEFPIHANVCYLYGSKASAKLCVNEDLLKENPDAVCKVNENKPIDNSGAPIHIGSLRETAAGNNKIQFTFDVKHVGTDAIFNPDASEMCSGETSDKDLVKVDVNTGFTNPQGSISCTGLTSTGPGTASGLVKLYSGGRTITCTQDLAELGDYEKELKISVGYYYKEYVATSILIRHLS